MRKAVARALLEIGAVGFTPAAPITFKSGIISPVYVDNRTVPFHPAQWTVIIEGFRQTIAQAQIEFDIIAGVAVGGVPHSAALAYELKRPSVFVRKEAKEHGKKNLVEGGPVAGKTVLLIEDLVTTGASSLAGIQALRAAGATVKSILAIVSYGFQESLQAFGSEGIEVHTLTDFSTILGEAVQMGRLSNEDEQIIRNWLSDPYNWHNRMNS